MQASNDNRPTILVVDDDLLIRMDLMAALEDTGLFHVIEAASADRAIKLLETRADIRLVITDIEMPGSMDGLALLAVIRARWPPVRLMVISGMASAYRDRIDPDVPLFNKPCVHHELVARTLELLQ